MGEGVNYKCSRAASIIQSCLHASAALGEILAGENTTCLIMVISFGGFSACRNHTFFLICLTANETTPDEALIAWLSVIYLLLGQIVPQKLLKDGNSMSLRVFKNQQIVETNNIKDSLLGRKPCNPWDVVKPIKRKCNAWFSQFFIYQLRILCCGQLSVCAEGPGIELFFMLMWPEAFEAPGGLMP